MRFFQSIINKELTIFNIKQDQLIVDLKKRGFKEMQEFSKPLSTKISHNEEDKSSQGFNYLLNLQLSSFTCEKIDALRIELERKKV